MSDVMKSSIKLQYNGSSNTSDITDYSSGFTFTDNADGTADSISISISNEGGKWLKKGYFPQIKDYFKAWINVMNWGSSLKNATMFCGKFEVDAVSFSGFPESLSLKGISIPIGTGINITQRSKTWKKQSVKSILSDIAKRYNIKLVFDASNHSIDEISQSGKTDLSFAYELCSDYDLGIKVYNDKLIVYDKTKYEKKSPSFTVKKSDVESYSLEYEITDICDSVKIQYTKKITVKTTKKTTSKNDNTDSKTDTKTDTKASSTDKKTTTKTKTVTQSYTYTIKGKSGKRPLIVSEKADSLADAQVKAISKLRENNRNCKRISLTVMGDTKYSACKTFKLEEFGELSGTYFIDSVTHNKSSKYVCTIEAHQVVVW